MCLNIEIREYVRWWLSTEIPTNVIRDEVLIN